MSMVDLNCDMGESFGPWRMGCDAEIMPLVTSANVACGFHAGDPTTIGATIELALRHNVAIGAHPGYPDLQGFGRRNIELSAGEVFDIVQYQVAAIKGMCEARGARLEHVKPHGALYNKAAADIELARVIVRAVAGVDQTLILFGLSGSFLISEAKAAGLQAASEVFADRTYQSDGSLTPRSRGPNSALISDPAAAARQVLSMVLEGTVTTLDGTIVPIDADTVCVHSDGPNAFPLAQSIRKAMSGRGISIASPARKYAG